MRAEPVAVVASVVHLMDPHDAERIDRQAAAIDQLCNAIRLTVEYVGTETLRPVEGWSWFDALSKYRPDIARQFVDPAPTTGFTLGEREVCNPSGSAVSVPWGDAKLSVSAVVGDSAVSGHQSLVDRAEKVVLRSYADHPRALVQLAELVRDLARAVAER